MGSRAFCFYSPAAVDYIVSPQGSTDGDVANFPVSVAEHRLGYDLPEIRDLFPHIVRFADHLLARCDGSALDHAIYDDLRARLSTFRQTCAETDVSPNGGPAERLGSLGTGGGPPSVSSAFESQ